jgi:D-sedoheptulose 7-phosphate isomerase
LRALALSDPGHLTCVANDYGFDHVFSRGVEAHGESGGVLVALSTSGNSPNVIKAAEAAKALGMSIIALTGKDGGALGELATVELRVPTVAGIMPTADRIQEVHIKLLHSLIHYVERSLFSE